MGYMYQYMFSRICVLLRVGIMLNQHINEEALHEWVGFDASLYWTRNFHGVHVLQQNLWLHLLKLSLVTHCLL